MKQNCNYKQIIQFALTGKYQSNDYLFRALNRAEISARLIKWTQLFINNRYSEESSYLLSSILGELANNAFDHNLGQWKDEVGCLVGFDFLDGHLRMCVVDRGQGIANSLSKVLPEVQNSSDYLRMAFEDVVSGRAPEQRGNGLKFVRKNFLK